MTSKAELLELIRNGENSGVEFKRDGLHPEDLARELVALSNLEGGVVLLGIEDDGEVSGLTRPRVEEWVMSVGRDKIRPEIVPYFEVFRGFADDKDIGLVRVTRGFDVHALWHNNIRRYLVRVGSQSRDASGEELARLFQRRGLIRAELRPVSGTSMEHLDKRRLSNYFESIRQQDTPTDEDPELWRALLQNTEIMDEDAVTVGGLLLFGKAPNRFLPHAGIDAVAHVGLVKTYEAQERKTLRGAMVPLLSIEGEVVENGLLEKASEFVRRNTITQVEMKNGRRIDRPVYPDEVIREGILNALVHRDYQLTSTDIELSLFKDRLEIVSPGLPPNGVTVDKMRTGTRSARNQLLKDVMRDYGYVEHMGMGIPRKIIAGMMAHNGSEPELIAQDEQLILRLYA